MTIKIRQELKKDYPIVFELIKKAFEEEKYSDQTEQFLVERLRKSDAFIPELSLVAEYENKVIGFVLLTKIQIVNGSQVFEALALAPVAVLPAYQKKGVGGRLITEAHERAKKGGFKRIVLLGHPLYYPRFGYEKASNYKIKLPFEAPDENCMVLDLVPDGLRDVGGEVVYSKSFYE